MRLLVVLLRILVYMPTATLVEVPRIKARRRFLPGAISLADPKFVVDVADDGLGDLVLDSENIIELAIVTVGPKVAAASRVDELSGHPHPATRFANTALDHVTHAEITRHLRYVYGSALKGEGRVSCDDEQPVDP